MSEEIAKLYSDLNPDTARFKVPFKSLFLCGGIIADAEQGAPKSLRDYIYRTRKLKLASKIVRAEAATQLYRDTSYHDLIEFEEDIARVASIVLVIAESPGSLAELGAFTVNTTIRRSLRIIAQTKYQAAESFIRFGPIERIQKPNPEYVGFYPWKVSKTGRFIASSARPHYAAMQSFIKDSLNKAPGSRAFNTNNDNRKKFYIIYWIIYLLFAASISVILKIVRTIYPEITFDELRNKMYCMKLMYWIDRESYSGKEYYFALGEEDPLTYRFPRSVKNRDSLARAETVRAEINKIETIPRHVRNLVVQRRADAR